MTRNRSKVLLALATVALLLTWSVAASGQGEIGNPARTIINFDTLSPGDTVTDQYASEGVVFSAGADGPAGLIATQPQYNTYFFGNSEPNFLIVGLGYVTASFINPSTGAPMEVSDVSARVGDADAEPEIAGVSAFDLDGNVVYSAMVHLIDEGATVKIPVKVSKVSFFGMWVSPPSGFAIDDLSFCRRSRVTVINP